MNSLIVGNLFETVKKFKENSSRKFKLEDREKIKFFLGLRTTQTELDIKIDQEKLIDKVFEEWGTKDCKPTKTSAGVNLKLEKANVQEDKIDEPVYTPGWVVNLCVKWDEA